jgi:hypothetical protein
MATIPSKRELFSTFPLKITSAEVTGLKIPTISLDFARVKKINVEQSTF